MRRRRHYYSTYCIHGLHVRCRLFCKVCGRHCRCKCHPARTVPDGDSPLVWHWTSDSRM